MKTILLIGNYPPPFGGISVHVDALAQKLEDFGYQVKRFDIEPGTKKKENVLCFSSRISLLFGAFSAIRKADILHFHTNGHNHKSWFLIIYMALAATLTFKKSFLTLHSGGCPAWMRSRHFLLYRLYLFALRRYVGVISVNRAITQELEKYDLRCLREIPAYLGLREAPAPVVSESVTHFAKGHYPFITTILSFEPEYGLDTILKLCREIRATYTDIGFLLIGSKAGSDSFVERVNCAGLQKHIFLAGELPAGEVYTLLKKSDLFLRTTDFDGDAISVREALSLGVPVVASRTDFRPDGVITYTIGDIEELIMQIACALSTSSSCAPTETEFFQDLIAIYHSH